MKKTISGEIYNQLEKMGNQTYNHIGFRDENSLFPKMLEEIVPEIGMKRKVKITIEIDETMEE